MSMTGTQTHVETLPQGVMPDLEHPPLLTTYTEALTMILGKLQAEHPGLADVLGMANAVLLEQRLTLEPDGHGALITSQDHTQTYHVDAGVCDCPTAQHRPGTVCKHRYSLRMHQMALAHLALAAEEAAPDTETGPDADDDHKEVPMTDGTPHAGQDWPANDDLPDRDPAEDPGMGTIPTLDAVAKAHKVPKEYLELVHGRPFVLYKGLLALAHEAGLQELHAEFLSVTADLALAQALAVFTDGRRFRESADATPSNVGPKITEHFARMALTRAKARCLRDALNIGIAALEELGARPEAEALAGGVMCPRHHRLMEERTSKRKGTTYWAHPGPDGTLCFGD